MPKTLEQITWAAPPGNRWEQRLDLLRERPGIWAMFGPYSPGTAYVMRTRLSSNHPEFEFTARKSSGKKDKPQAFLYVRFRDE